MDPSYSPELFIERLDILPLLVDRVIIYDPSEENLEKWGYPKERFSEFVQEKICVPLYVEFEGGSENILLRQELIEDEAFLSEYQQTIDEDLEDQSFGRIADDSGLDPRDAAFSVNWDLIVSQILSAAVLTSDELGLLWTYKFARCAYEIGTISQPPETIKQSEVLKKFLYRAIGRLPENLTIDEILSFRKEKRAKQFREWLGFQLQRLMEMKEITSVNFDEEMHRDFLELLDTYKERVKRVSAVLTVLAAGVAQLFGGPMASIPVAVAGDVAFPRIVTKLWKHGWKNWAFLISDLK